MKELQKWDTRLKLIKVANMLIIPFFVLAISIIGLTIYSRNVGNFVIKVSEASEAVLSLSESPSLEGRNILLAQGVNNMRHDLQNHTCEHYGKGSNNDNRKRQYACYSHLKNISDGHRLPCSHRNNPCFA